MNVKLEVNGKVIPLDSFMIPEMSLSSARSTMIKEDFQLYIHTNDLVESMQDDYGQWVEESKRDDEQCGCPQDELAEAGYPPLENLTKIPELIELVFGYYLRQELFDKFLPPLNHSKLKHWSDEIISCSIEGEQIVFNGICYARKIMEKPGYIDRKMETVTLYRPTGPNELRLIEESGFKKWPPRLPEQPIFYPVTNQEYAKEIAVKWNVRDDNVGYVTKFEVKKAFMEHYEIQKVGGKKHTEWWIPAEDLEELNANIIGVIEVIGEYR